MSILAIDRSKKFKEFFDKKSEARKIEFLVLHHIQATSAEQAISMLSEHQVSSHFLIDESGKVFELVDENDVAYHAGVSFWKGSESLNKNSIGIEFINSSPFSKKFEAPQMQAGLELCRYLMEKYKIPAANIVGHSDIAYYPMPHPGPAQGDDEGMVVPTPSIEVKDEVEKEKEQKKIADNANLLDRKQDPSHFFDWKFLATNGVGIYHEISIQGANDKVLFKLGDKNPDIKSVKEGMSKFGYRVINVNDEFDHEMQNLTRVFHRHFNQEKFDELSEVWYLSSQMILDELLTASSSSGLTTSITRNAA